MTTGGNLKFKTSKFINPFKFPFPNFRVRMMEVRECCHGYTGKKCDERKCKTVCLLSVCKFSLSESDSVYML